VHRGALGGKESDESAVTHMRDARTFPHRESDEIPARIAFNREDYDGERRCHQAVDTRGLAVY